MKTEPNSATTKTVIANSTIKDILEKIRNAPYQQPVILTWQDRLILDELFVTGWTDVGYYAGHRITFKQPFSI